MSPSLTTTGGHWSPVGGPPLHPFIPAQQRSDPHVSDHYAITFSRRLTDDEAEQATALLGYAWSVIGGHTTGTTLEQVLFDWQDHSTVAFTAPLSQRTSRTRTSAQARADFFTAFSRYCLIGTPTRRDDTRLVEALGASPIAYYTAQP